MALFQKKPSFESGQQLYTLGAANTFLIIGLGNAEDKYNGTRHNVGFAVLDYFAEKNNFPSWNHNKHLKSDLSIQVLGSNRIVLCKPTTLMNLSGEAVQAVQRFYKIENDRTLVIYDELAISFGQLRTRQGGSDAGHNGVKSLIAHGAGDSARLRIGIANEASTKAEASAFVLGKFTQAEQERLDGIVREASVLITEFIFSGRLNPETRLLD